MADNHKLIIIIKKYCYIILPILLTFIYFMFDYFDIFTHCNIFVIKNIEDNITTLIGMSGTLIGFLFTAMTILFSLNKDSNYMKRFKHYGHHIIFCRMNILGIIFLFLNIVFWMFNANVKVTILPFILGFLETIMAAYYTYKLSLNSFQ